MNNPKIKERASEAIAGTTMMAFNSAARLVEAWNTRRELQLLGQGIIGGKEGQKYEETLGSAIDRSRAYKNLHQAIDEKFKDLANWHVNKYTRQTATETESSQASPFSALPCPNFDGHYSSVWLYDERADATTGVYVIQQQATDSENIYTLTRLDQMVHNDGSRDGERYSIDQSTYNSGEPLLELQKFTRIGDQLDLALLTNQLLNTPLLATTRSHRATGAEMVSAQAAEEFADTIAYLKPVSF